MKRLECTKCREVQQHCKCDNITLDFVELLECQRLLGDDTPEHLKGPSRRPNIDTTDKVS